MSTSSTFCVVVDGEKYSFDEGTISTRETLLFLLRDRLGITAAKEGCGEGGCGACTVVISFNDVCTNNVVTRAVTSCLVPALYVHKMDVWTSAGVSTLMPQLVDSFETHCAVQCGYCTPGFLCATATAAQHATADIEECLDGNICRCTGYSPLIQAFHACSPVERRFPAPLLSRAAGDTFSYRGADGASWVSPGSLQQMLSWVTAESAAVIGGSTASAIQVISGNTDVSYHERYHPDQAAPRGAVLSPMCVPELHRITLEEEAGVRVGAAVTIRHLKDEPIDRSPLGELRAHLKFFANNQVRSIGTIGGSIISHDCKSDLWPPLLCFRASLITNKRRVGMQEFDGLAPDEVLLYVFIPWSEPGERVAIFKQGKRRSDAQTLCTAAFSSNGTSFATDKTHPLFAAFKRKFQQGDGSPTGTLGITLQREPGEVPVGSPIPMARESIRGSYAYIGDMALPAHTAHATLVLSHHGHARITGISVPSDVTFFTLGDAEIRGERVFASPSGDIEFHGHPIGIVIAKDEQSSREAAARVSYDATVLPLREGEFFDHPKRVLVRGDISALEFDISGSVSVGGQDHMYLETPCCIVIPQNDGGLLIHCTTQNPSFVSECVAQCLGLPIHKVRTTVDRIGGGFGGKQDRPAYIAVACALAAVRSGRPVRLRLTREEDMMITGERHSFTGDYQVCVAKETGKIEGLKLSMMADGGHSQDLSLAVLEVAMSCCPYEIPNVEISGRVRRTSKVTGTAFRGFGKPQGGLIFEVIMERVGREKLRFSMCPNNPIAQHIDWAEFERRRSEIAKWNESSGSVQRAICALPTLNNTGFDVAMLNQAGALVNIYKDGTVSIHHSGCEMGQGLQSKLKVIAAKALQVNSDEVDIKVNSTDTGVIPNTSATAATTGTDLNGHAVAKACAELLGRLEAFQGDFKGRVEAAYVACVQLSAAGFHTYSEFELFDWGNQSGSWTYYPIYGVSVCEVVLDRDTGDWRILRADLYQEIGAASLNEAVDVGQVKGGFMQGVGLYTMEELVWASGDNHLRTRNVSTYKVPCVDDTPLVFNVSLIPTAQEPRAIYSAKTVGEAGLQHALALKRASGKEVLDSPATVMSLMTL